MRVLSALVVALLIVSFTLTRRNVLFWMGLERTGEDIEGDLKSIQDHLSIVNTVSFEAYDLGWNSTLILNKFTPVNMRLRDMGIKNRYAMITTVNVDKIKQLLDNPKPFIDDAVKRAVEFEYTGYNIDFEPTIQPGQEARFIHFLNLFGQQLHKSGKKINVDVASWCKMIDFNLLRELTDVDKILTMDTYAEGFDTFMARLEKIITYVPDRTLIGAGLLTEFKSVTGAQVSKRVDEIMKRDIDEIDVWMMPPADDWWPALQRFAQN